MSRDKTVFDAQLKRLGLNFGRKIERELADSLYEELRFIPDEAWSDLADKAMLAWDSWPRNFVKAIKFFWYDWQGGRKAEVDFQDCEFCYETGVLDFLQPNELPQSCYCGHCNNYLRHVTSLEFTDTSTNKKYRHLRLTVEAIAARGWTWDAPPPPATREEAVAAFKEMMAKMDERAEAVKLEKYQQVMFDQERQPHDDDFLEKLKQ
jgi:hypothetical protein